MAHRGSGCGSKHTVWVATAVLLIFWNMSFARGRCERYLQTGGPEGGHIHSLAIDPTTPSTIYAATWGWIYRSTDHGTTWAPVHRIALGTYGVLSLAIDRSTPTSLYAGVNGGTVYRSTDGGATWTGPRTQTSGMSIVYALAIDPINSGTLYAGTWNGGVRLARSTDRGMNWVAANSGLPEESVYALAIDPVTPSTLYAGTDTGVYASTDRGEHWTAMKAGLTNVQVNSILIDPSTPSRLYAGTLDGVYTSTNRGVIWTRVDNGPTNVYVRSLAINPSTSAILYAGTEGGVYRSTDYGSNWARVSNGLASGFVQCLAVDPSSPSAVYAGTRGGLYGTNDRGDTWLGLNRGLTNSQVLDLAVDPVVSSTVYVATRGGGIYRSTDRGASWTSINRGIAPEALLNVWALAIDPATPSSLYAATDRGIYKSANRGESWTPVLLDVQILEVAIDPVRPSNIYAGSFGLVYRSNDYGASWGTSSDRLGDIWSLVVDPVTPDRLYAGTLRSGVFRSNDRGKNWAPINNGLTELTVYSLAINPVNPSVLYAATERGGLCRTTDRGETWTKLALAQAYEVKIDPSNPSNVYVTDGWAVYRSTDSGENWTTLYQGLEGRSIWSLALDPLAAFSSPYVGSPGSGVFRFESDCTLQFSQFGKGLGFTSDVVLTNPSSTKTVSGTIKAADDSGLPVSIDFQGGDAGQSFSIPPQSSLTLLTDGLGDLLVGSAVVAADGDLNGIVRFKIPGIGIAGVGASQALEGFIAPVRRRVGGITTGVALTNPDLEPITLDLALRDEQGQDVPGGRRTIEDFPGGGHLAQFIDELFPDARINEFHGTLVVRTRSGKIAAAALELGPEPGQFTTLPVTPLSGGTGAADFSFAQFGNGEGFTSDVVLANSSSDSAVSGTVRFYNDAGQAMSVRVGGTLGQTSRSFSIPPLGLARITSDGGGTLRIGSARVTSSGPVGAAVRFAIPGMGIAGVGASESLTRFLIPVRRTAEGIRTGIALQNRGEAPVTIALTLRDAAGRTVATAAMDNLSGRGHLARFLEELFDNLGPEFQGTICAEVEGGSVAAAALELGLQPGEFTTLPVTPLQ